MDEMLICMDCFMFVPSDLLAKCNFHMLYSWNS